MPLDFSAPQYAPAQTVVAAQLAVGQATQAVQTFLQAVPTLQTGQSIGIAVPAGTAAAAALLGIPFVPQTTIRIRNDLTGEIRSIPIDYYNANANTIYGGWTPV